MGIIIPLDDKEQRRKYNNEYAKRTKYAYQLAWQKRNSIRLHQYRKNRYEKTRNFYIEYKKTLVCSQCGFNDWRILEFHHINGEKNYKDLWVSRLLSKSINRVKEEIAKCVPLCPNCHALIHLSKDIM